MARDEDSRPWCNGAHRLILGHRVVSLVIFCARETQPPVRSGFVVSHRRPGRVDHDDLVTVRQSGVDQVVAD